MPQELVLEAWSNRELLKEAKYSDAGKEVIEAVDKGQLRVASPEANGWVVNEWVKKAILMYFGIQQMQTWEMPPFEFYDKMLLKTNYKELGVRAVPPATARYGAYIAKNVVLMPSYVNIGAYVDEGTMVDTWATVGSCAQIVKNVHLSGGVGIGGVLEPVQANPTIIGDNCFIGARSEVVEGVIVEDNSVISMGVYIGQSTKIYDRETGEVTYGRNQLVLVSEEQAQASSVQAYAQTLSEARKQGKLSTDAALNGRVKRITDRLIVQAGNMYAPSRQWKWSVAVIDEPTLNAWCMPGGKMAIYTGIVEKLKLTDDEIAQIMGHEIAHALLGHGRERMSRAMAMQGGMTLGSILAGRDLSVLAPVADVALTLPNSRENESEADRYGIELAARAGYNPRAAISLWEKMGTASGNNAPTFLSTH